MNHPTLARLAVAAATALALTGCGVSTTIEQPTAAGPTTVAPPPTTSPASKTVTVLTHDSFALSDAVLAAFTADTGFELKVVKQGDGGSLVNQLVLTKDAPLADAVYGIDNTFAGRALTSGVLAPYASPKLPADASDLKADGTDALTPIDYGDVCVNADKNWFAAKKLPLPVTLDDLTKPEYKGLLVVEDAASSSTGMAFLAGTVGAKTASGYLDYWGSLKNNGVKVVKDWSAAYYTEFSGGGKGGTHPLVVSYASSPAATVAADGKSSSTVSLNETCFRQIEYAGVLNGAKNVAGAKAFVDWMLSDKVQADIPGQMYVYPSVRSTKLPAEWASFAPVPAKPFTVAASDIAANRDAWIKAWTAKVVG